MSPWQGRGTPARRASRALLIAAAMAGPVGAADVADVRNYPNLAAMKKFLDNGTPAARQCALMGGLFVEANELIRKNNSEGETAQSLMRTHQGNADAAQRARLAELASAVSSTANIFQPLDSDSAIVAFTQLCVNKGGNAKTEIGNLEPVFEKAVKCEGAHPADSLARKDCVAGAFRAR